MIGFSLNLPLSIFSSIYIIDVYEKCCQVLVKILGIIILFRTFSKDNSMQILQMKHITYIQLCV